MGNTPPVTVCHVCQTRAAEMICHICKTPRLSSLDKENSYANAMLQREKLARAEGSSTQYRSGGFGGYEMNTRGEPLKPGR